MPELTEVVKELENQARKIGLYLEGFGVSTLGVDPTSEAPSEEEILDIIKGDDGEIVINALFAIGDVAWSKRVMDPEQEKIDDEFRMLAPNPADELRERMKKALEEGKNILDIDPYGMGEDGE